MTALPPPHQPFNKPWRSYQDQHVGCVESAKRTTHVSEVPTITDDAEGERRRRGARPASGHECRVVRFADSPHPTRYTQFPNLPIWMATEVMSFGALSQMFKGMTRRDQKAVSARYGRQPADLASWMHHLVYVRNLCAHHCRLWDRTWAIKPDLPAGRAWAPPLLPGNRRLFATLLILCCLLRKCPTMAPFAKQWRRRVEGLLAHPPAAPHAPALMGLPAAWQTHPCWD